MSKEQPEAPIRNCYDRYEEDLKEPESSRDDDRDSLDYNNSEEENGE